ncbi:MAG: Uma2 family endonuclease [Bacteroidota bacterium]
MPVLETLPASGLTWEALCDDPRYAFLHDLPFKIETNRWGQLVMSPHYQRHSSRQTRIALLLQQRLPEGTALVECAVQTDDGVKVADTAWYTAERWAEVADTYATPIAPEICVEVYSQSNTQGEFESKRALYLAAGAEEVWVCDRNGHLTFFDADGPCPQSKRVPDFPTQID